MSKKTLLAFGRRLMVLFFIAVLSGCVQGQGEAPGSGYSEESGEVSGHLTTTHLIRDIVTHPAFEGFGELLLPRDDNSRYYDTPLRNAGSLMPYHGHVEAEDVVDAINRMIDDVSHSASVNWG